MGAVRKEIKVQEEIKKKAVLPPFFIELPEAGKNDLIARIELSIPVRDTVG